MKMTLRRRTAIFTASLILLLVSSTLAPGAQVAATGAAATGNAASGAALFDGRTAFQNGGAECMACHTISSLSISIPGGGTLGPDLTGAAQKYGGPRGLVPILGNIPFPTMVPVYRGHPLLPQEQVDLAAFLAASPGGGAAMTIFVACLVIWIMVGLYMILHSLWFRRLGKVRSSLQER